MNAIPNKLIEQQNNTDVVHEAEEALVEVGAVSETKGGIFGQHPENGGGYFP